MQERNYHYDISQWIYELVRSFGFLFNPAQVSFPSILDEKDLFLKTHTTDISDFKFSF